jgi:hypothetical protein
MFNRRSLQIKAPDLNQDLRFFDLERSVPDTTGLRLSQAELLLGSFFFVHRARSSSTPVKTSDGSEDTQRAEGSGGEEHKKDFAFEFLHNTFGEFLVADFILRRIVEEIDAVEHLERSPKPRKEYERKLNEATGLSKLWFAALMYSPLHQRPVILEMTRQWLPHKLRMTERSPESFLRILELLVNAQLNRILTASALPPLMSGAETSPFESLPLLGHCAIYSLNLVLLRTVLSASGFNFDEKTLQQSPDGCRAWDRLTNLWRSWFSLESLARASAIISARRKDDVVEIRANENFTAEPSRAPLDMVLSVSTSLADGITAGLAGYVTYDATASDSRVLFRAADHLMSNKIDVALDVEAKSMLQRKRDEFRLRSPYQSRRPTNEMDLVDCARRAAYLDKPNAWRVFVQKLLVHRYDRAFVYVLEASFDTLGRYYHVDYPKMERWLDVFSEVYWHLALIGDRELIDRLRHMPPFYPELHFDRWLQSNSNLLEGRGWPSESRPSGKQ